MISCDTPLPNYNPIGMAQVFSQIRIFVPIVELLRIPEHRDREESFITTVDAQKQLLVVPRSNDEGVGNDEVVKVYVGSSMVNNRMGVDPFYTTLIINGWLLHKCMLDSRGSNNVMPLEIMNELGLKVSKSFGKCFAMDSKEVNVWSRLLRSNLLPTWINLSSWT